MTGPQAPGDSVLDKEPSGYSLPCYFCPVTAWFSHLAVRCRTASFAWFWAHVIAWALIFSLLLHFRVNRWFWIIGGGLAVSNILGQTILDRRKEPGS
jgi:hypothetical protein